MVMVLDTREGVEGAQSLTANVEEKTTEASICYDMAAWCAQWIAALPPFTRGRLEPRMASTKTPGEAWQVLSYWDSRIVFAINKS